MRKTEAVILYVIEAVLMMFFLFFINISIMWGISATDSMNYMPIEKISSYVNLKTSSVSEEGIQILKEYRAFGILVNQDGKTIWSYHKPSEFPDKINVADMSTMSRWYYMDYPITNYLVEDCVLIVGQPKSSMWKLQLVMSQNTAASLLRTAPFVLVADLLAVILIPFLFVKKAARKKEQQRTAWIAGVSHDIRTPLALVLGYTSEVKDLADAEKDNDIMLQKLDCITEQSLRIRTLVTNLNMESKLTNGMGNWKKESIPFAALIREVMCDFLNRSGMEKYDVGLEIEESLETMTIQGDSDLLKRMIENLLNNAVNHNPDGCQVAVRLGRIKNKFTGYSYIFSVEDDGCGVTREALKELSKPLSYKKRLGEHGLGTRLVRLIAKKHGFRVRFFNRTPKGFCCKIWLK